MKINTNFLNIAETYLFSTISRKVGEYKKANPDKKVISLGIGDVTRPISHHVAKAMADASMEMGVKATFRGYGPEQGYDFLKNAIKNYYGKINVELDANEIFVSDGAKSDLGNILDLFAVDNTILVTNPVYPVYVDTNVMAGRKIVFLDAYEENSFLPEPDLSIKADIIYLCSPNNPTGSVYTYEKLKKWVDYANANDAIILYDAAYEAFVKDSNLIKSIFEIEGSKTCAIEFCSLSKTAGFTGIRCGYTIVPLALIKNNTSINKMWLRRQTTKFNGVSYIVQRGAEAVFSETGLKESKEAIDYYLNNAKIMMKTLDKLGISYTGGTNSPYVFFKVPYQMTSWAFFDYLLDEASLVSTPGSGFGDMGEGYIRFTSFGSTEDTIEAMKRFEIALNNLKKII